MEEKCVQEKVGEVGWRPILLKEEAAFGKRDFI